MPTPSLISAKFGMQGHGREKWGAVGAAAPPKKIIIEGQNMHFAPPPKKN